MISKKFIKEVVKNPFLTDKQKLDIYFEKVSKSANSRKKFPCPNCGAYNSHIVKRSTYWKRLCAACGLSFDKHQNLEYQHQFYDYKGKIKNNGNGSKNGARLNKT